MREAVVQNLSADPDKSLATAARRRASFALEHVIPADYFAQLFWRTFPVGTFECTIEQYNQGCLPQAVVEGLVLIAVTLLHVTIEEC